MPSAAWLLDEAEQALWMAEQAARREGNSACVARINEAAATVRQALIAARAAVVSEPGIVAGTVVQVGMHLVREAAPT